MKVEDARFTINADPETRHVRMVLNGLWNETTVASFEKAIANVIAELIAAGAPFGTYRTLIDLREQGVLTQVVAELSRRLTAGPGTASERIAVVVATSLQKLQQNRISAAEHLQVFQDFDKAERWVFSDS